jgi:thioredoxin reductase (NADPH)
MSAEAALDCLIIGGGPAGLTAALYLRRFHRRALLLDDGHSRVQGIGVTHNVAAFPEGIAGARLLQRMRRHLALHGGGVVADQVLELRREAGEGRGFHARSRSGLALTARTVLLASGVVDRAPAMAGIAAIRARGLLRQCPICDGHEFSNRRVLVIGGGAHGAREALFMHHYSDRVSLLLPAGATMPDAALREALKNAAIDCLRADEASELRPGTAVPIELDLADGAPPRAFDVIYAALGNRPRSALAEGLGAELDALGCLLVDAHCRSNVAGLFGAGDVVSALDQIAVAVGHGAIAATTIHNELGR